MKRNDYLSWDDYFMALAKLSAMRSKDPSTQVGACIVGPNKRVLGVGYNGFPNGCSDGVLPWNKEGGFQETKYAYVVHAEVNAIMNSNRNNLEGSTLYITLFPCNECAKVVVQAGIKKIYYLDDHYHDQDFTIAARRIFNLAGVKHYQLKPRVESIEINFGKK
jgi:dCMP deaminase